MENKVYTSSQIAAMYADLTGPEIVAVTGLALLTVYDMVRDAGVEVRPPGHRPVLESPGIDVLTEMLVTHSQREVAEMLGVSKRTVQRWLSQ